MAREHPESGKRRSVERGDLERAATRHARRTKPRGLHLFLHEPLRGLVRANRPPGSVRRPLGNRCSGLDVSFCAFAFLLLFLGTSSTSWAADAPATTSAAAPVSPDIVSQQDIVYGQVLGAALLADIAYPKAPKGKSPAILSVHGGRWMRGTKRDNGAINVDQWAGLGFVAMTINYRLRDCSPPPACYQDVQCAIRYLHAHAEQYNLDGNRVFLIGQSAGGHMVSLAATMGNGDLPLTGGWQTASNNFRAAICVSGAYDLKALNWGNLWTPAGVDPELAREIASPIRYAKPGMQPLLIFHADNDKSVPIANALAMVKVLEERKCPHVFHHYETNGHMKISPEVIEKSLAFIRKVSEPPAD